MIIEPPSGISIPPKPGQCSDAIIYVMWACVCLVGLGRFLAVLPMRPILVLISPMISGQGQCTVGCTVCLNPVQPSVNALPLLGKCVLSDLRWTPADKSFVQRDGRLHWAMPGLHILIIFQSTVANLSLDMGWSCCLLFMMSFCVGVS